VSGAASAERRGRWTEFLALERNVVAVAGAMFLLGLGEELWKRFVPKYLEALGAPVIAIGLYGTIRDFLDGAYQYPGGWFADRFGRRTALVAFISVACAGYALYAAAPGWPFVFAGLALAMAWSSMASPTLFAVVGDALPRERRAMGFTVQSILRRVPIVVAPTLGGLLIAAYGIRGGVRVGLITTMMLAVAALAVVWRVRITLPPVPHGVTGVRGVWRSLPPTFHRLLGSDVLIRTAEGMVDVFLVIYATNVIGVTAAQFGILVGVQMATAIAVYIPAARLADRVGRKPLVVATFLAFSLFPVAVILAHGFATLLLAFVVGGLREIGEPARKALIVDLAQPHLRARSVGLYYLLRSLAITPAALVGGLLWTVAPALPFLLAGAIGLLGTAVFALTVDEAHAA
jgi:MFS family permease